MKAPADNMTNQLRIGIAGLGNVGVGVLDIVKKHGALLADRAGVPIKVTAVAARNKAKDRGHDLTGLTWFSDPVGLAKSPDIDVFVELMGGEGDPPNHPSKPPLPLASTSLPPTKPFWPITAQRWRGQPKPRA